MDGNRRHEGKPWLTRHTNNGGSPRFTKGGRCTRRTLLEKVLLLLLLAVVAALIAVVIVLIVEKNKSPSSAQVSPAIAASDICMSQECVKTSASVASNMDLKTDPCDNFYQFSCGQWLKENVIPDDQSSFNIFGVLTDKVDIILKDLLEQPDKQDIPSIKKAKDLYASCMNMDQINKLGDGPIKQYLADTYGGWPLTNSSWDEGSFDLATTIANLHRNELYIIITLYVSSDNMNSSRYIMQIDQPSSFGLPGQKYYLVERNDTMLKAYEEFIYAVGNLMGFANASTAAQDIKDIVDFEIQLANISVPDEQRRDSKKLYNPMTLREIIGNYSQQFNWTSFFNQIFSSPEIGLTDVTGDEILINLSPLYYERLSKVLEATPKRTIANFLMWRLIKQHFEAMGDKYLAAKAVYDKVVYGTTARKPRYKICGSYTTSVLSLPVGQLFIKDNFDVQAKNIASDMITQLQASFNELLAYVDWMDEDTKLVAKEKNAFISPKIGYPKEVLNNTYLEEAYKNLTYDVKHFFNNILTNKREDFFESFRQLRKEVDKEKWAIAPSTINAYYSSLKNQIMFPAGILQPPFFSKNFPMSMNYGGIGMVIGHEITHGFDDRGRQYDKNGNLVDWWSSSAIDKFKGKASCIIEQYGNFTEQLTKEKLNGINTQGENIADNGGLKQSFRAYRNWVDKQGKEEQRLPGLNFTHNQLFFINFAQLWCNLMTKEDALSRIKVGVHSPGEFRVIGSVQNSKEFSEAFNCPLGSNMNPQKKCSVW
ncbi:neprilysin-1-like isoform X2 [Physella acuta]|uniref:neprilysin-1-like isoform X2 n=1 Tax=Physella acuta TaxID=109671 RepID=UPI0027DABF34|nr:neprilysin-1-like isoform X2 [Physella acuta]